MGDYLGMASNNSPTMGKTDQVSLITRFCYQRHQKNTLQNHSVVKNT